ncbi:hypothetical protein [Altibacter sp. HG106]|uniref:hypothetical protein n=1 Tax=Altibacter sp. HG106 TaxID=3023937 RepID=UPI00235086D5|nr:hypothetical protein [Altibacter sp. HG106]MDC7993719.1 hypothetical protein [Altibacter sp. HG106]
MHQFLVLKSFEEAEKKEGVSKKFRKARVLSDYIQNSSKNSYTERSLADKYDASKAGKVIELPDFVVQALCRYLGYETFEAFQQDQLATSKKESKSKQYPSWKLMYLTILLVISVAIILWQFFSKERWMEWKDARYVEAPFNAEKLKSGNLKLYRKERIEYFKRIDPNCDYQFFNPDGSPRVFYGKNSKKEYEWFTQLGEHPETGKPLKAITKYMIEKYICNNNS